MAREVRAVARALNAVAANIDLRERGGEHEKAGFRCWVASLPAPNTLKATSHHSALVTDAEVEAGNAQASMRVVGTLWQKAKDLRDHAACEKEMLRKQLKEGSALAQEVVEQKIDAFLVTLDAKMLEHEESFLALEEQGAMLDQQLQQKRKEYEEETGENLDKCTKRQKGGEAMERFATQIAEVEHTLAQASARHAALIRKRDDIEAERDRVETEVASLAGQLAQVLREHGAEGPPGSAGWTLEAKIQAIKAKHATEVHALQNSLADANRRLCPKRNQHLLASLLSFLQQTATNPQEMDAMALLLTNRFSPTPGGSTLDVSPNMLTKGKALLKSRTGLEVDLEVELDSDVFFRA